MIKAPWTAEQVEALNRWQRSGFVHEFTCGNDHDGSRVLRATPEGWVCDGCDYTQDWAHDGMLMEPKDPFGTDLVWVGKWVSRDDAERWSR